MECRQQLHQHKKDLSSSESSSTEERLSAAAARAERNGLQIDLDSLHLELDNVKAALLAERDRCKDAMAELDKAKVHLASTRVEMDMATRAAEASVKQRDRLREDNTALNSDLKTRVSAVRDAEERHSAVLNKFDNLHRTHAQTVKLLEDAKQQVLDVTAERDQVPPCVWCLLQWRRRTW